MYKILIGSIQHTRFYIFYKIIRNVTLYNFYFYIFLHFFNFINNYQVGFTLFCAFLLLFYNIQMFLMIIMIHVITERPGDYLQRNFKFSLDVNCRET